MMMILMTMIMTDQRLESWCFIIVLTIDTFDLGLVSRCLRKNDDDKIGCALKKN